MERNIGGHKICWWPKCRESQDDHNIVCCQKDWFQYSFSLFLVLGYRWLSSLFVAKIGLCFHKASWFSVCLSSSPLLAVMWCCHWAFTLISKDAFLTENALVGGGKFTKILHLCFCWTTKIWLSHFFFGGGGQINHTPYQCTFFDRKAPILSKLDVLFCFLQ